MLDHLTKRIVPFVLTFAVSALIATALQSIFPRRVYRMVACPQPQAEPKTPKVLGSGSSSHGVDLSGMTRLGSGSSGPGYGSSGPDSGSTDDTAVPEEFRGRTIPYRITFQPKALYTDAARANNVQGGVRLKITLLANGDIGSVTTVTQLPDGLTEQAIAAAKKIRFEPKRVNGVPVSVLITREYTFTIY
jgi:TonB family protein